jgi:hydroxyacylglutathione hydrolase
MVSDQESRITENSRGPGMLLRQFVVGLIETNCYLAACEETKEAFIVDPDLREDKERVCVINEIERGGMQLKYIINTHFHTDHTGGNGFLKQRTDAELLIHEDDAPWLSKPWIAFSKTNEPRGGPVCPACGGGRSIVAVDENEKGAVVSCKGCGFSFEFLSSPFADRLLKDGDVLRVGMLGIEVIHTPGHSPGGISLYLSKQGILFSGDTLFNRSIGRTDLPYGSFDDIMVSLKRLMALPDDTIVYPGHGEKTVIGEERGENPYVR